MASSHKPWEHLIVTVRYAALRRPDRNVGQELFGRKDPGRLDWVGHVRGQEVRGLKEILDAYGENGWELATTIPISSASSGAIGTDVLVPLPPGPPREMTLVFKRPRRGAE